MNKSTYRKSIRALIIAIGIAAATCLVAFITLLVGGIKPGTFVDNAAKDVNDPSALESRLTATPDYGNNYINNIIFLGDKTVYALGESGLLKGGTETLQVWSGESGDLSLDYSIDTCTVVFPEDGASISIKSAAERKKPDYIVITLGLNNGVAYCTEEKFKEYYGKLIDVLSEASPNTKIILQSIFPVTRAAEKRLSGITNDKIDDANGWIEELALEKGVRYLHTASVLKAKNGTLDEKYDSGNGITLNESGYSVMLDYIRTHGYK
ncbi:MAG: hypothetical protein IJY39_05655 [Clostridia bacterium]|nr:hypothetical protein [Clostridia bacterium]